MNNQWIIFQFLTNHEAAYSISNYLQMRGAAGITVIDKADFLKTFEEQETPDAIIGEFLEELSFDVNIEAYFFYENEKVQVKNDMLSEETNWISVMEFVSQITEAMERIAEVSEIGKGYVGYRTMRDEDWSEVWKSYYQTLKFGKIVINPSWIEYQAELDEIVLQLDPGSACGTGSHETTSLLLEMLSNRNFDLSSNQKILDLGTGSGILAIAAAKLFPENEIDAIDIDEHAVKVAQENAALNDVKVHFFAGELTDCAGKYDFILANLIAQIHIDLAQEYIEKLNPEGILLASGIIDTRVQEVIQVLTDAGLTLVDSVTKNDWHALLFQK